MFKIIPASICRFKRIDESNNLVNVVVKLNWLKSEEATGGTL